MECVIVSYAKDAVLQQLTVNAINTAGCRCVIVEGNNKVDYDYIENTKTVHYDFPFNYNRCLNLGFSHTTDEYICFSNNDVLFGNDWQSCVKYLDRFGSISLIYRNWFKHKNKTELVYEGYNTGEHLCGWGIIMTRDTYNTIGGFDEGVDFWCSDDLYGIQLQHAGIKHALITEFEIQHLTSITLGFVGRKNPKLAMDYTGGQVTKLEKAKKKYGTSATA